MKHEVLSRETVFHWMGLLMSKRSCPVKQCFRHQRGLLQFCVHAGEFWCRGIGGKVLPVHRANAARVAVCEYSRCMSTSTVLAATLKTTSGEPSHVLERVALGLLERLPGFTRLADSSAICVFALSRCGDAVRLIDHIKIRSIGVERQGKIVSMRLNDLVFPS